MNHSGFPVENTPRIDLLDELFRLVGCGFLSDLPQRENQPALHRALTGIAAGDFAPKAWNEAACYLCGSKQSFETAEQARAYLLEQTGRREK